MAHSQADFKSGREFKIGLLLVALAVIAAIANYPEVRYGVSGLQEIRGRVTEVDTRRSRMQGYTLIVGLATENGAVRLEQKSAGEYAGALAPGQPIRAWVGPRSGDTQPAPIYPVWQIERGGQIVMRALDVGDRVLDGYLKLCGGLLIPLLGGLALVVRHCLRRAPDADGPA